eukprot:GFUD01020448.1.p1 GENE.GFUD01020448.1~~GFUD01020448.1.p1  ORF type:complete len:335 (+),score=110.48 GFUD01020448.1:139-1143(+)
MYSMLSTVLILCTISAIAGREWEDACQIPSGLSPSPSSCSSYFYCSALTRSQEGECEEGKLWNKELEICDLEQNVSCGKGIFWYLKTGLQLAVIAGRVTNNLMNHSAAKQGSYPAKNENMDQPFIKKRFGSDRLFNAVKNDQTNTGEKGEEAIRMLLDTMTIRPQQATTPSQDEGGSVSVSKFDDVEVDNELSEQDRISIADFVDKKVAISVWPEIMKQQAPTPSEEEEGSGSLAYYEEIYFDDTKKKNALTEQVIISMADLVNKNVGILFQPEETTPPPIKLSEAFKQMFLQRTSKDSSLSEIPGKANSSSELPAKVKLESKSSSSPQPLCPG